MIWGLTKKWNSKLVKFNGNQWSSSPFSLSGFHNASESASTVGIQAVKEKSKKAHRAVFRMHLKHKSISKSTKVHKGARKIASSVDDIKKGVNHAAKTINGLTFANASLKKRALRRLARASAANKSSVKGAAKASRK